VTIQKIWNLNQITMMLREECCFYANQSGIVRENAFQLLERLKARERNRKHFGIQDGRAGPHG
jgi:hypothetical protein